MFISREFHTDVVSSATGVLCSSSLLWRLKRTSYGPSGVELSKSHQSDLRLFPFAPPHPVRACSQANLHTKRWSIPPFKGVTSSDVTVFWKSSYLPVFTKTINFFILKDSSFNSVSLNLCLIASVWTQGQNAQKYKPIFQTENALLCTGFITRTERNRNYKWKLQHGHCFKSMAIFANKRRWHCCGILSRVK